MATYLDSPQAPFVSESSLPSSLRFSASRLVFCLAIGVAVVSATGIMLARMDVPNGAVSGSGGRIQTSGSTAAVGTSLPAKTIPFAVAHIAVNGSPSAKASVRHLPAHAAAKAKAIATVPDAVKPAIFRLNGKEFLVAKMISIPVADPAPANATRASDSAPTALNPAHSNLDGAAKPASL